MPDPALAPLDIFQWGREDTTAKGTAVAATKIMVADRVVWTPQDLVVRPQLAKGLMWDNPGNEVVTMKGARWTARGPFTFEQFHRWLEMAIVQCVTPTGTDPYTWVFTHDPTAAGQVASYTMQRRFSDGSNTIDQRIAFATLETLTLRGRENALIEYEASGFARPIETSAITAGQALPTIINAPFAASKLYLDPAYASLGSTQLTGGNTVLDWEITIRSGAVPIPGAEARSDLSFTGVYRSARRMGVDFRATMLVATNSGQYATEKTAAEAQSLRALRLQFGGASSRDLKIDALLKYRAGSLYELDESDGLKVVGLDLVSATDATNALVATLVNKTNETP